MEILQRKWDLDYFMAEREARKAGAASSRAVPAVNRPRPSGDPRQRPVTDPKINPAKIMRDGKELVRESSGLRAAIPRPGSPRAATSPALQEIPKRRNPPPGSRSPILRDGNLTNGSGRGPGRGSR